MGRDSYTHLRSLHTHTNSLWDEIKNPNLIRARAAFRRPGEDTRDARLPDSGKKHKNGAALRRRGLLQRGRLRGPRSCSLRGRGRRRAAAAAGPLRGSARAGEPRGQLHGPPESVHQSSPGLLAPGRAGRPVAREARLRAAGRAVVRGRGRGLRGPAGHAGRTAGLPARRLPAPAAVHDGRRAHGRRRPAARVGDAPGRRPRQRRGRFVRTRRQVLDDALCLDADAARVPGPARVAAAPRPGVCERVAAAAALNCGAGRQGPPRRLLRGPHDAQGPELDGVAAARRAETASGVGWASG